MQGPVAIILAAGHGKRMKSERAKVLHEVCGRPMIRYVVEAVRGAGAKTIVVVVGYGADQVRAGPGRRARRPLRHPGAAARHRRRRPGLPTPARRLPRAGAGPGRRRAPDPPRAAGRPPGPAGDRAGRLPARDGDRPRPDRLRPDPPRLAPGDSSGSSRSATARPKSKPIREVNPSCYVFELPGLWDALDRLDTGNAQGEYYLTDAPGLLQAMGRKVIALPVPRARRHPRRQHPPAPRPGARDHAGEDPGPLDDRGGEHRRPRNTYIDGRAEIGRDTVIFPFSVISGRVKIGVGCRVGPFAHLRDGTVLDDGVEVGAFVEVNRSHLEPATMARHLAYLGERHVGRSANVGAGAITANFDGRDKHRTHDRRRRLHRLRLDPGRAGYDRRGGRRSAREPWSRRTTTSNRVRPSSASRPVLSRSGRSEDRGSRSP